nr:YfiR family protein [uncultured Sphingomonas sp.]
MAKLPLRLLTIALALSVALFAPGSAQAQSSAGVKAALVYNIIRFISFPGNPARIRICTIAGDNISGSLRALSGRAVGNSRLEVVAVGSVREAGPSCDVVYLESAQAAALGSISRGQVVIGEGPAFAERGGTVGLVNFGGQIRFAINSRVARNSGVQISAQLMQLAAKVVS